MKSFAFRSQFTGRHMLGLMVTFFGVVVAVNLFMARQAITGFGGTVVDNSYVASQNYNRWLAEARAQTADGWQLRIVEDRPDQIRLDLIDADGIPIPGASIRGKLVHPLGSKDPLAVTFIPSGDGHYAMMQPLPKGRWSIQLIVQAGTKRHVYRRDLP